MNKAELEKKRNNMIENYLMDNRINNDQFTKQLKISSRTYHRFKAGESVSLDVLYKFADALKVHPKEIR